MRQYYQEHSEKMKKQNIESMRRKVEIMWDYKKMHPCVDCGENDYRVLAFHHIERRNGERWQTIGEIARHRGIDILRKEMEKCIVLCMNCHLRRHWEEDY